MGEMPARLHVNYEAGSGQDVEVYVDGKYVLGVTYDEIGSKGVAAVAGAARHVAAALAAPAPRPKLEVVTTGGLDEYYVNGKAVADDMDQPTTIARRVARALGADIDETDDPAPQPYMYFVVYQSEEGRIGNTWWTGPEPIETPGAVRSLTEEIKADKPELGGIVVTNFILMDGPF